LEAVQRNTDGEILPALWIAEYKLHGENSYVFRDADVLARMYRSTAAVNDPQINGEALEFVLTHPGAASLSDWLARFSDARAAGQDLFTGLETAAELAENRAAMTALSASETAMTALGESGTAMNAVCSVEMALEKAMKSTHYEKTMREKGMPIAKIALALAKRAEFSTISTLGEMVENSAAMTAVAASATAMTAVAASATAMTAVAGSAIAMNKIAGVKQARDKVMGSEHYAGKMRDKDMPIAKLAAALAGIEFETISGMAGIVSNSTAMSAIAASGTAMSAIAASGTAMSAIAASATALSKIIGNATARSKIENSATAKTAMKNSPRKTTWTRTNGGSWMETTIRNGKGFVAKIDEKGSGVSAGYVQCDGTNYPLNNNGGEQDICKFFTSKLLVRNFYNGSTVVYIPIS